MKMYIFHGRSNPKQKMEDWGFDGPTLEDVIGVKTTYLNHIIITFANIEAFNKALVATGWEIWDQGGLALVATVHKDLLVAPGGYYGDWSLEA